jgi:uncharacterized protein
MWADLFAAIALLFVFEGMMPFANPQKWRETILLIAKQPDKTLRTMGLISMLLGCFLVFFIRKKFV